MNVLQSEQVEFPISFLYNVHFRPLHVSLYHRQKISYNWLKFTFLTPIAVETHSYSSEVMHLYITNEISNAKKHIWGFNAAYL